jgi:hypothetical protein
MTRPPETPDRRRLLAGLAALAVTAALPGCTGPSPDAVTVSGSPTSPPTPTGSHAPSSSPPSSPTQSVPSPADPTATPLPVPPRWSPSPRDADPAAKRLATGLLVAAGSWDVGEEGDTARRLRGWPADRRARQALVRSGVGTGAPRAVAGVLTAQLGGLLPESASVMVVLQQWTDERSDPTDRTFDVRLRRRGTRPWTTSDVLPAQPDPPLPKTARSRAARRVLTEPRLRLPHDARADVASGVIDDRLLTLLLALAADHVLDITVLRSGHPYDIFDKPQVSDHTRGRAADVWAIDGRPVVRDTRARVLAFMRRAASLGAYQVGGPWDPGPPSAPYYTNDVHLDHVHLGVPAE